MSFSDWLWDTKRKALEEFIVKNANKLMEHSGGATRIVLQCTKGTITIERKS